ncbi:MAG TPA: TIGR03960 family B12-binding radical SAM protein [Fibrobacteria bacterium]|nr:TIGR03960 family B12-binding radical SAM protein [Fibrobacteria bacterium]
MRKSPLLDELEKILPFVKNPGKYIGGENNQVVKDPATLLADMVLLFPDAYELGMSHNGTKVLYHILNREPDLAAERAFAPMPDMAEKLRAHGVPLYALESYRPIAEFSAIGISLQTELNYTNVPYVLELGGLKAFSRDRAEADPFVIGGGPCMANPEPVADFFDLFVIGDGEILAVEVLRCIGRGRKAGSGREAILRELSGLKGVYVPRFLEVVESPLGETVPAIDGSQGPYLRAKTVQRAWVEVLNKDDYPVKNLVPHVKLVHDRFSVEVMRGCTQGCRFCQAGYWYRPNRELNADAVVEISRAGLEATGETELGLLSLSTADYGPVEKVLDALIDQDDFEDISVSLPSLRANSFGQGLARKAAALNGGKSATFAPETGSERLRKMINKTISDKDMYEAAESVFANGFHNIKLYTMVGLPTENLDDMRAFCGLIDNLDKIGRKYSNRNTVHASIGILVPKPFTPMQWVPFMDEARVNAHIRFVREAFKYVRSVRISWSDYGLAHVESFYSRADRKVSAMIYKAYKQDQVFESFGEHFKYDGWKALWAESGYPQERMFRERALDEVFPWDFIHAGANKGYLKNEYRKMLKEDSAPVPDCKWGDCQKCGIPGNGLDTKLSAMPEKYLAINRTPEEIRELAAARKQRRSGVFSYHLLYRKSGLSRYIAHQNTLDLFERGFRRLKLKLNYSEGYSPRPIIRNTGALPLGLESRKELLVIETRERLEGDLAGHCKRLSGVLPAGMEVISLKEVPKSRMPHVADVTYRSGHFPGGLSALQDGLRRFEAGTYKRYVRSRDKDIDLADEIQKVWMEDEELCVRARTHPSGSSISPYLAFAGLLDTDPDALRSTPIYKDDFTLERAGGR